ncbi:isocitrate lyase/PEP mutase family protein [Salinactinospora qingdaonensis]|uniref:Isocitrate lyase/phosphoenolpyruvate mutase family protein n=1 Tax=Salinactinospora qingdaonensis TaxID=702744 RepID=A0ABP7FEK2_9ACTN
MNAQRHPAGQRLAHRLAGDDPVLAAGCHDALTARLAEDAGLTALHLSGAAIAATTLGLPDLGFVGAADMIAAVQRITAATTLPVIADADTGYGDALQAAETTRRYEHAGAAALHIEDQVMPKRCGHLAGKRLVPLAEASARIGAAVEAREQLLVIARTDALSVAGLPEALRRVRAFADHGADAIFVEGAAAPATLAAASEAAGGLPLVLNRSEAGSEPTADLASLTAAGVRLVIFPVAAALAAADAARRVYEAILRDGEPPPPAMTWDGFNRILGLPALVAAENRWASPPPATDPTEEPR